MYRSDGFSRVVFCPRIQEELPSHGARQRLAVFADANQSLSGRVRVGRYAGVNVHGEDPARSLGHFDLVECRREPRVGPVVDRETKTIDGNVVRNPDDGVPASHQVVGDSEYDRSAASVGHADGPIDRLGHSLLVVPAPFLEVDVLRFQLVRRTLVQAFQQLLDFSAALRHDDLLARQLGRTET